MIVIYNPTAGRRRGHALWRVLDVLIASGMRIELAETTHAGHAIELAREAAQQGARMIVAAGGDGTIAEVANGLVGSAVSLGVIPIGTANVLAHELALPFAPAAVAKALAFGRTLPLWPGIARGAEGERLFVQMLGVGLDAQVVHRLSFPLKRALGRGAYVVQTLRELARYDYAPVRILIDGVAAEAGSVIVSKGRLYGGRYTLAPAARPELPGFSVALFGHRGPISALMYGAALPLNLLPHAPGILLLRADAEVVIESTLPAQSDGDAAGVTPLVVRNAAGPIAIVTG